MIKDRLVHVLEYKGVGKEAFYKKIGMTSASFRGNAKKTPLNSNAIENILSEIPDLNPDWLLTGKGEMLREESSVVTNPLPTLRKTKDALYEAQKIPLFNLEATMGLIPLIAENGVDDERIVDYLTIPNLPACDGSIYATGDSMYPLLKAGDIVAYKTIPVDVTHIFFGEIYVLSVYIDELTTFKTIKFVQPSDMGPEYVKLISHNQHHAPKDVRLSQIAAMALVRASIRLHN